MSGAQGARSAPAPRDRHTCDEAGGTARSMQSSGSLDIDETLLEGSSLLEMKLYAAAVS